MPFTLAPCFQAHGHFSFLFPRPHYVLLYLSPSVYFYRFLFLSNRIASYIDGSLGHAVTLFNTIVDLSLEFRGRSEGKVATDGSYSSY